MKSLKNEKTINPGKIIKTILHSKKEILSALVYGKTLKCKGEKYIYMQNHDTIGKIFETTTVHDSVTYYAKPVSDPEETLEFLSKNGAEVS